MVLEHNSCHRISQHSHFLNSLQIMPSLQRILVFLLQALHTHTVLTPPLVLLQTLLFDKCSLKHCVQSQLECLESKSNDARSDLDCVLQLGAFDILLLFYTFSHSRCTRSRLIGPTKKKKSSIILQSASTKYDQMLRFLPSFEGICVVSSLLSGCNRILCKRFSTKQTPGNF